MATHISTGLIDIHSLTLQQSMEYVVPLTHHSYM